MMHVMITGGGTGGHIYPALAIAGGIESVCPEVEILYVGSATGLEKDLAIRAGYHFQSISVAGLPRPISWRTVQCLWKNVKGVWEAKRIIKEFQPDLVVGTGGYACGPLMLVAAKKKIPTLLHEQNAVMGVTNQILSKYVQKICLTFPIINENFRQQNKTVQTGLPVRDCILQADRKAGIHYFGLSEEKPVVMITGGSQGALHLNQSVAAIWQKILAAGGQIIHIAGPKLMDEMVEQARQQGFQMQKDQQGNIYLPEKGFLLLSYLHEMEHAFGAADVVIGRAGASFLAELMAVGRSSILIPYPYATGNHQEANAKLLVEHDAAKMILDQDLNADTLWQELRPLLEDEKQREKMASACKTLGRPHAVADILAQAEQIVPDWPRKKV